MNVECRRAGIGCVDDKKELLKHLLAYLKPIQDRRKEYAARPEKVAEIIAEGSRKAAPCCREDACRSERGDEAVKIAECDNHSECEFRSNPHPPAYIRVNRVVGIRGSRFQRHKYP